MFSLFLTVDLISFDSSTKNIDLYFQYTFLIKYRVLIFLNKKKKNRVLIFFIVLFRGRKLSYEYNKNIKTIFFFCAKKLDFCYIILIRTHTKDATTLSSFFLT